MIEKYRIGKIHISNTKPEDARQKIQVAALAGEKAYICVSNMRMVRFANKNSEYRQVMKDSMMNLPDGTPLEWLGKLWGLHDVKCTNGPSLFNTMLQNNDNGLKHFLLGDTEDTLKTLVNKYTKKHNANIVGTYSPPFMNVEDFDYPMIADLIKRSGASIVWVAMRAPKQDLFGKRMMNYIDKGVFVGVGRAFRFATGEFVLPEGKLISKLGLTGFVSRRQSFWKTSKFYIESIFYLLFYCLQIIFWRLMGKKPSV